MHVDPTLPYQGCLVSISAIAMSPLMQVCRYALCTQLTENNETVWQDNQYKHYHLPFLSPIRIWTRDLHKTKRRMITLIKEPRVKQSRRICRSSRPKWKCISNNHHNVPSNWLLDVNLLHWYILCMNLHKSTNNQLIHAYMVWNLYRFYSHNRWCAYCMTYIMLTETYKYILLFIYVDYWEKIIMKGDKREDANMLFFGGRGEFVSIIDHRKGIQENKHHHKKLEWKEKVCIQRGVERIPCAFWRVTTCEFV